MSSSRLRDESRSAWRRGGLSDRSALEAVRACRPLLPRGLVKSRNELLDRRVAKTASWLFRGGCFFECPQPPLQLLKSVLSAHGSLFGVRLRLADGAQR